MEPWNIKEDDTRTSDSLPTFIIFCEDNVSEPIYFKYFETNSIKVNAIGAQFSKDKNVIGTISHCTKEGIFNEVDGRINQNPDDLQVWCVYDRDKEGDPEMERLGNTKFDTSIRIADASGINVAWSNDSFELWILLHFEDVDVNNPDCSYRRYYYDRLTDIFRNLQNPCQDLISLVARQNFNYKQDMKHANNFRNIVRAEIVGKTVKAISRAVLLDEHHSNQVAKALHQVSPFTKIHKLVEELIRLGGKEI